MTSGPGSTSAVVTGSASGIGRATATRLAARGLAVVCLDLDEEGNESLAREVEASGGDVLALRVDVADTSAVAAALAAAVRELGPPSAVVTSAGIFDAADAAPIGDVGAATFERVLRVNLLGTFNVLHHALPLLEGTRGAAVTIASTAALRGHGRGAGYTASKGGVEALTRLAAVQYGPSGVRVNCVCPGGVDTPMAAATYDTATRERIVGKVPLRKLATPEEVAEVIDFLLRPEASHVTGATVTVDGGSTIAG